MGFRSCLESKGLGNRGSHWLLAALGGLSAAFSGLPDLSPALAAPLHLCGWAATLRACASAHSASAATLRASKNPLLDFPPAPFCPFLPLLLHPSFCLPFFLLLPLLIPPRQSDTVVALLFLFSLDTAHHTTSHNGLSSYVLCALCCAATSVYEGPATAPPKTKKC